MTIGRNLVARHDRPKLAKMAKFQSSSKF